ncbi:hypothetical protein EOM09_04805 [bacterium]|nr:hypothetical protein [bacterium]
MLELMLGDYFGLTIIDLNYKRSLERLERLGQLGPEIDLKVFDIVKDRFDDHRDRLKKKKPGGIHYTLTDKGLINVPLEIQILDYESAVRDMFGPNKHFLYSIRNKKASLDY